MIGFGAGLSGVSRFRFPAGSVARLPMAKTNYSAFAASAALAASASAAAFSLA